MIKHQTILSICATTVFMSSLAGAAFADKPAHLLDDEQEITQSAEQIAAIMAETEKSANLLAISTNRAETIDRLVADWSNALSFSERREFAFNFALQGATDQQLLDILKADNFDTIRGILKGKSVVALPDGITGIAALGDIDADLVFTPTKPCRLFDTRLNQLGIPLQGGNPGSVVDYWAWGYASDMQLQGGTVDCMPPGNKINFSAIAANFTVVPVGKGHIRVWPYGEAQPDASFLNYNSTVNSNLANAGIVSTCFLCNYEISVSTWYGGADSLGDIMGYYYPAELEVTSSVGTTELGINEQIVEETDTVIVSRVVSVPSDGMMLLNTSVNFASHSNSEGFIYCYFVQDGSQIGDHWWWEALNDDSWIDQIQSRTTSFPVTTGTHNYALMCKQSSYDPGSVFSTHQNLTTLFIKSSN